MNRENENANTPDVDDESVFNPHPFTEDEPVTREQAYADTTPEDTYADATRDQKYAGANRTTAGVPELGPLFDETLASDFQQQWGPIQSGFVEDPQGAVRLAKDLTDSIVSSLARALEERRNALDQSARNGDTEQLRLVLRQYREVLEEVTSL